MHGAYGISFAFPGDRYAKHQFMRQYSRLCGIDHCWRFLNVLLPVLGFILSCIRRIGFEHEASRLFLTPLAEGQLVAMNKLELSSFQRSKD